jgi:hypothetical protein
MSDRVRQPLTVTSTRIGRTDLGAGLVTVDDEAIVVVVQSSPEDRSIHISLSAVDDVAIDGREVALGLHDGMRLALVGDNAEALREQLMVHCRAIPELTRALRAFGSRRGHASTRSSGPSEQKRFFAPLLDARRAAVSAAHPEATLGAFDTATLERAIEQALQSFAAERYGENAAARRALEAELVDLTEPLKNALGTLSAAANDASVSVDDLRLWRAWSAQLRATFETADRVWLSLDAALDATPWHS